MSAKYTFLAWDTPISNAPLKLALLQLANNADDDGFSYYSISKMADACGMSERTFMRKIAELEKMDVLKVERRSNRPSLYTLVGDEMGVTLCHLQSSEVTESHSTVTESHLVGDRESHDLNNTPNNNPDICQLVADEYNLRLKELASVSLLSDTRKSKIKASIKQFKGSNFDFSKLETWSNLFEYISNSDFLMGRRKDSDWQANFDFVINKTNLIKIVEGQYQNGES